MPSKISSPETHPFLTLLENAVRTHGVWLFLCSVCTLLAEPFVILVMGLSNRQELNEVQRILLMTDRADALPPFFGAVQILLALFYLLASSILVAQLFHFLFDAGESQFALGLPLRRTGLFLGKWLSGALLLLIPMLLHSLAMGVIFTSSGAALRAFFPLWGISRLNMAAAVFAYYSLSILLMLMVGRYGDHILLQLGTQLALPLLVYLLLYRYSYLPCEGQRLAAYSSPLGTSLMCFLEKSATVVPIFRLFQESYRGADIFCTLLLSLIFLLFSLVLFRRRPLEQAERPLGEIPALNLVPVLWTLGGSFILAMLLTANGRSPIFLLIWLLFLLPLYAMIAALGHYPSLRVLFSSLRRQSGGKAAGASSPATADAAALVKPETAPAGAQAAAAAEPDSVSPQTSLTGTGEGITGSMSGLPQDPPRMDWEKLPATRTSAACALFRWFLQTNRPYIFLAAFFYLLFSFIPSFLLGEGISRQAGLLVNQSASLQSVFVLLLALLLTSRIFAFLHRSGEVQMFQSFPESRGRLFATLLASLSALLGLLQLCFLALDLLQMLILGDFSLSLPLLLLSGERFLNGLAVSACLVFFYVLTANAVNAHLLSLFANLLLPLLSIGLAYFCQAMLPMMADPQLRNSPAILLSPYVNIFALLTPGYQRPVLDMIIWPLWYLLLFIVVLSSAAYFIYQRRPIEYVGREDPQHWPFVILRYLLSLGIGLGAASLIAWVYVEVNNTSAGVSQPLFFFGLLGGSFLASMLQDYLISRGDLRLRRTLGHALLVWIPLLLLMAVLMSGAFGYSSLPARERVSSITLEPLSWPTREEIEKNSGLLTPDLVIRDLQARDALCEALACNTEASNPGLALPRTIFSRSLWRDTMETRAGRAGDAQTIVIEADGRKLRRELYTYLDPGQEIYQALAQDPALALYFVQNLHSSLYAQSVDFTINKGQKISEDWAELFDAYGKLSDESKIADHRLLSALASDYARMEESSRRQLRGQTPISLKLGLDPFFQRLYEDRGNGLQGDSSKLSSEEEPLSWTEEQRPPTWTVELPVTEDCKALHQALQRLVESASRDD